MNYFLHDLQNSETLDLDKCFSNLSFVFVLNHIFVSKYSRTDRVKFEKVCKNLMCYDPEDTTSNFVKVVF